MKQEQGLEQEIISESCTTSVITIDLPHPPAMNSATDIGASGAQATTTTNTTTNTNTNTTTTNISNNNNTATITTTNHDTLQSPGATNVLPNDSQTLARLEPVGAASSARHGTNQQPSDSNTPNESTNSKPQITTGKQPSRKASSTGSNENGEERTMLRFKWTKEKSQVAMNLVKHGCKPKLVAVAVGCSLRTAQKFVETVTPKIEGESFKDFEIRRRGRKSKNVNNRLEAIKAVLSRDSKKTQVEIAADLKVSNTTVCRDLKRMGASWRACRATMREAEAMPSRVQNNASVSSSINSNDNDSTNATKKPTRRGRRTKQSTNNADNNNERRAVSLRDSKTGSTQNNN